MPENSQTEIPQVEDEVEQKVTVLFDGQWLPDQDPAEIGAENFKTLENMRYRDKRIEGVQGYTKINTVEIPDGYEPQAGFHFKKDQPSENHVLVQVKDSGDNQKVLQNKLSAHY